jgi:hypothetical protein
VISTNLSAVNSDWVVFFRNALVYASLFLHSAHRDLEVVLRTDCIRIARHAGEWDMYGKTCMRQTERHPV